MYCTGDRRVNCDSIRTIAATFHRPRTRQPVFFAAAVNMLFPTSVIWLRPRLPNQNKQTSQQTSNRFAQQQRTQHQVTPITHNNSRPQYWLRRQLIEGITSAIFTAPKSVIWLLYRLRNQFKQTDQQTTCSHSNNANSTKSPRELTP